MKRFLHFSIFTLLLSTQMFAQSDSPVIVVSSNNKAVYQPANGGAPIKVRSGAVLKNDGALTLKKGGSIILMRDGKFAKFNAAQQSFHYDAAFKGQGLGFEYDFAKYIEAAVDLASFANGKNYDWVKSLTDPQKGGDGWSNAVTDPKTGSSGWGNAVTEPKTGSSGWGNAVTDPKLGSSGYGNAVTEPKTGSSGYGNAVTDPKTGSSGWGNKNAKITAILPFGNVLAAKTIFFWSNPGKYKAFQIVIKDASGKQVFSAQPRDSFCVVDLSKLNLATGQNYQWSVAALNSTTGTSNTLQFEIKTADQQAPALNKVRNGAFFKEANDPALTQLAEAVSLEKNEWYYSAWATYQVLHRNGRSNLSRMMEAAFWARYDLLPLVEKAARK